MKTKNKKRTTTSPSIEYANFLLNSGGLKLKYAPDFKKHLIFLIVLLTCTVFFASCSEDSSSNSSPLSPASNTQTSAITPIGAPATCLTIHSPSLVKLANGHYMLVDEINNCSGKITGHLKITAQIDTETTKLSTNLVGSITIPADGKAIYHTFTGRMGETNREIDFHSPTSSPAIITVLVTIKGAVQGEWDGQVTIPTK